MTASERLASAWNTARTALVGLTRGEPALDAGLTVAILLAASILATLVGREYSRRIKQAFDKAGIEIPFPHMKVVLPDNRINQLAAH